MSEEQKPTIKKKREEALPERLLRRVLESMGDVVDRKFGRTVAPKGGLTTSQLIERMKKLIDERVRDRTAHRTHVKRVNVVRHLDNSRS